MKEGILRLRSEGKSYRDIVKELGCSKGTVAYHCGVGQKEKNNGRVRKTPRTKNDNDRLYGRYRNFCVNQRRTNGAVLDKPTFTFETFKELVEESTHCYLTGRELDIDDMNSWQVDHKVPHSKGGSNEIINLGITCKEANQAKSDLYLEEFLNLCRDVLVHHGYKVK
jgi:5-methylcytosine-specific restriction endonuclease McrA